MTDRDYHAEERLTLFGEPAPAEAHELVRVSNVGSWYRATCSCGWASRIAPERWRVERQHRSHVVWERTPLDERRARS